MMNEKDSIRIVRLLIKTSSLIEDVDEIMFSKLYKRDIKKLLPNFMYDVTTIVNPRVSYLMVAESKEEEEIQREVYLAGQVEIGKHVSSFFDSDSEEVYIVSAYVKVASALQDIAGIEEPNYFITSF